MKFFAALFFSLYSLIALAQECKEVNLVTKKDSPFQKIPVYDQDGLGACYAYTAAQLMDYYLIDNGKRSESSVSPIWVGIKHAMYDPKRSGLSSGDVSRAIKAVRKLGHCNAKEANKVIEKFAKAGKIRKEELINILENYQALYQESLLNDFEEFSLRNRFSPAAAKTARQKQYYDQAIKNHNRNYCPTDPHFEELEKLVKVYLDAPTKYILDKLASTSCPNPVKDIVPPPVTPRLTKNEEVEKNLISQLQNKKAPAGISYCSAFWSTPSFNGTYARTSEGGSKQIEGCSNHASIVVGMKPVNNQCHFLVRNTWGSKFSQATANWKCLCKNKKTKAYVDNCTNKTHNNGQFSVEACWIPSDVLNKNVFAIQTLSPK